jgi:protein gp37
VNRARGLCFGNPLANVWLGVSVEDQARADERIPLLLQTPSAVRFISAEPLLGSVDLRSGGDVTEVGYIDWLRGFDGSDPPIPRLDWVIVGGESGPGARPFHIEWARAIVTQCQAAHVPVFVKQLGADPRDPHWDMGGMVTLRDRKGGDPSEWPEDLRVREFPAMAVPV